MTSPAEHHHLIDAARAWYDAGYCVVPSHEDGGKRPFGRWKDYQNERLPWDELETLLNTGRYTGIGVITGAASGNVELIEIEGPSDAAVERLARVIDNAKELDRGFGDTWFTDLINNVTRGCVEKSAGGGLHFFIRVTDGPATKNTKLANNTDGEVIAETRGQGGFVIVAPTPGRNGHPEGATYAFARGTTPAGTVNITSEERDALHLMFTHIDETPHQETTPDNNEPSNTTRELATYEGTSTFDAYRATPWREILEPHGWTYSHSEGERDYWVRPGKTKAEGISASSIEDGPFYCFSTNAGLPTERGLSKADIYAHYNHGGDRSAAARDLAQQGYGQPDYPRLAEFILTSGETTTSEDPDQDTKQAAYERMVREAALKLKINKDAKHLLARIELGDIPPLQGITLTEFMQQEDEVEKYRVNELWPAEGRVLLSAAAKAGKTTMVIGNLIPSLIDGTPFLGKYETHPVNRRIVYLNMEVGERTLRSWTRRSGIHGSDQVTIVNLRGKASSLQLSTEEGRNRLAEFLREQDTEIVILDPLAPVLASLGIDENDNSQIAQFFSWWSETLTLAGVTDDLIVHHTGHEGERSRGASRLLDEPDAIWTLKRKEGEEDPDAEFQPIDRRFLHAYGRDVELPDSALAFDPDTGILTMIGGSPAQMRDRDRVQPYFERILTYLQANPGASTAAVIANVRGKEQNLTWALRIMATEGLIDSVKSASSWCHMVRDTPGEGK